MTNKTITVKRDDEGTAYITEGDGKTRVYAIEAENDEGWYLERQTVGGDGDESPERLTWHDTEDEALTELRTFLA